MAQTKGMEYLKRKLDSRRTRVLMRYRAYDMKRHEQKKGITIDDSLQQTYAAVLGWCSIAVDSLADRLVFREFENDNFELNEIFNMNNPDVIFDSAILSALISSCSFIYIIPVKDSIPRLRVIDGSNATGEIDPITGLLTEGYAVLDRDKKGNPIQEAYFVQGRTDIYLNEKFSASYQTFAPAPLLVPIIYRPDAMRPFGHSRISRSALYYQAYAKRTLTRSDISAEFYSFPQKYITGLAPDAEPMDKWKATISAMLQFSKDEDGDSPMLGQFTQQSMSPYTEQLRTAAAGFAGETALTLDDLGFVTDNPSSSEAIKASHERLRVTARKAQRNFGTGFLNAGYLAACTRDNFLYKRDQLYQTIPKWEPVFELDSAAIGLIGDGAIKINQAIPDYFTEEKLRDLIGF